MLLSRRLRPECLDDRWIELGACPARHELERVWRRESLAVTAGRGGFVYLYNSKDSRSDGDLVAGGRVGGAGATGL